MRITTRLASGVGAALVLISASPAFAQTDDGEADQGASTPTMEVEASTSTMEVEVGIGGYAHPDLALPVVVDVTSEVLIVGQLEVTAGGSTVTTEVEIPAGSVKQFVVDAAPPGSRSQVEVTLVRIAGEERQVVAEESLRVSFPSSEVLVGVIGVEGIDTALRSAATTPLEREIVPLVVDAASLGRGGGPLGYLVIDPAAASDLSEDTIRRLAAWVGDGGRVIAPAAVLDEFAAVDGGSPLLSVPAAVTRLGRGELIAVEDVAALTVDQWSAVVRDVPPLGLARTEGEFTAAESSLVGAATAGREASVPALPWLLVGIIVFVLLVGPVNFLLLRRLGRPEAAWVTVPVLSAVFVAAFWIIGRSSLQDFTLTLASVVFDDGLEAREETALVLQTEEGGTHTLALPAGWAAAPTAGIGVETGVARTSGNGAILVDFDLEDLGVGATQATAAASPVAVDVSVTAGDRQITVGVVNRTGVEFWAWGIVVDGVAVASDEALPAGGEAEASARTFGGVGGEVFEPVISVAVSRRLFYDDRFDSADFQMMTGLAGASERQAGQLRREGVYFFGFTDAAPAALAVDGRAAAAEGTTLVVKRVTLDTDTLIALGRAEPDIVSISGASTIEQYSGQVWAYGAQEVVFRYVVPDGVSQSVQVDPGGSQLREVAAYDWAVGEFVTVAWGEDLDRFLSPAGEIVLRARPPAERFFDEGIQLYRYAATWGAA
ncbi:MAG TPA: hypothetical protein VGC11_16530 [Acidimicrobiia bacterium]